MQFRRLLDKLPAGAYTCDPTGLITFFNQRAVHLWGRAPRLNDPTDRFCGSFKLYSVDGAPIPHSQCWMALALTMDREYNGNEIIIERPDGRRLTALAYANPIRDESGKLLGAVNVLVDISERKHTEDALKEANRYKDQFIAMLAHELRNPLAPIRNAVELMHLQALATPEMQWAVGVIDRQMQQMTRLVDDLLDLARVTGNKLELRAGRIDVGDAVRAAVEISRPIIDTCGQQFILNLPSRPIYLNGDLTRLAQVISNLLNNAARYTPRGGCIWLDVVEEKSDVVIKVRDTGVGISSEMLSRIFDMFTQAEESRGQSQGGLGIGLTLAKHLVDMHGGTITAQSEGPEKGSEFIVRFPAMAGASEERNVESRERKRSIPKLSLRVLVVDDNPDAAISLAMLLRTIGNQIHTIHDGVEAVTAGEKFRPDAILLDIGMPGMNGYDTARAIRREAWGKDVLLIAISGWGQDTDRQRSAESGFDHHLMKPVDFSTLVQLLQRRVANQQAS